MAGEVVEFFVLQDSRRRVFQHAARSAGVGGKALAPGLVDAHTIVTTTQTAAAPDGSGGGCGIGIEIG